MGWSCLSVCLSAWVNSIVGQQRGPTLPLLCNNGIKFSLLGPLLRNSGPSDHIRAKRSEVTIGRRCVWMVWAHISAKMAQDAWMILDKLVQKWPITQQRTGITLVQRRLTWRGVKNAFRKLVCSKVMPFQSRFKLEAEKDGSVYDVAELKQRTAHC
jgi:hypothetical protein